MRKTITLLIALLALCLSSWATTTTVTLTGSNLANFIVSADGPGSSSQTINGSVNITVTAYAPATGDYSHIAGSSISVDNGGTLTFTTSQGKLTRIYIECNQQPTNWSNIATGTGWDCSGDPELTWTGDASSVELASNGSSSFYFGGIQSIEFTVDNSATPSSSVEWNAGNGLSDIYLIEQETNNYQYHYGSTSETIGTVTAAISATTNPSSAEFKTDEYSITSITLTGNGTLTFSTTLGQFERIVINTNNGNGYKNNPGDWSWSDAQHTLTWHGALPSSTVVLDDASVDNITSIVFTFAGAAPASDGTITWGGRQANHVSLSCSSVNQVETSSVIKDIITSLKKTGEGEYCEFIGGTMHISNCGKVIFQSIVGELTGIVISCSNVEKATDLSDDWTYDAGAKTLTWAGTSSNEVTLSGDIYCFISSIEFTYTPVSAPRLGQTFTGSYGQTYEITGLHTAKVIPQSIFGTLDIPDYEVYDYETYYITEIDDYAFSTDGNDNDIANAFIGANVAKIGAHAFENNSHMTEVFVRSTVLDAIGEEAFKNCLLLHGFECYTNMPPALGNDAFDGDTRINRIAVSYPYDYQDADGWLSYAAKIKGSWIAPEAGEIFFYDNQTTVNLYAVVAGATYNTRGQAKVMPYTSDVNAIYPITRTGTLIIPEEVMYMGRPYDVTGIGANAYENKTDIDMVVMPLAVTSIETGAFQGCTGVTTVQFLWDNPNAITWADSNVGAEFKTATNGGTKIVVPEGKLEAYKTWAPAWAGCMTEGAIVDVNVTQTEDPNHAGRYYRTFYDSSTDYMLPPSVWAHVGYVENNEFILRPIAFDGQIVPRGTAVVLESETPTYRLIPMGNSAPLYTDENKLVGTDVDIMRSSLDANADKVYVLNKEATLGGNRKVGMGMYRYTGTTLGAHKAYLIYDAPATPGAAPGRFLFRHESEEVTGLDEVQHRDVACQKLIRDGQLIILHGDKEYNAQGQLIK